MQRLRVGRDQVEKTDKALSVELNDKSMRRAVTAVNAAEPSTIAVVIQGRLEGDSILEAGIVAQAKTPKPAATEAA
jgi:hypothetical protein